MAGEVYISGALFMSRDLASQRELYEFAAGVCERAGYIAYVPHQHTDPELRADADPAEVYAIDSEKVKAAKAIVAFANEPSFGTGMEIMLAVQHKVPVTLFRRADIQISRYLRGFLMAHGYADAQAYTDETDLAAQITGWLQGQFAAAA